MQFGIHLPPFGPLSDARTLADLAVEVEQAGWDGLFLWDDLTADPFVPVGEPWITFAAIALRTTRLRFGPLVTPLPRRRPWNVARETVALDHLSQGRLIFGVGSGGLPSAFDALGEEKDAKARAAMLEEGLQVLTGLWSGDPFHFEGAHYHIENAHFLPRPAQAPRIPIWVAGGWPHKAPFRRAARWDGVFPLDYRVGPLEMMAPQEVQSLLNYIAPYRVPGAPFDVVQLGITSGEDAGHERALLAAYADVGVTWWLENFVPQRWGGTWSAWPVEEMQRRIRLGPPAS